MIGTILYYLLPTPMTVAGVRFLSPFVCLSVCLSVIPHDASKTDAASITKMYVEMFQDESWKTVHFGVKRSKVKVTSHKTLPTWVFALL